jgi:hypothetical protein
MILNLIAAATMTWYGGAFLGQHHAAHWHGQIPAHAPSVVTTDYPGVAACTDYEFGTVLRFKRGERIAYGIVVDRRARYGPEYCGYFDAWPALAQRLGFGPSYGPNDKGVVQVEVSRLIPYHGR